MPCLRQLLRLILRCVARCLPCRADDGDVEHRGFVHARGGHRSVIVDREAVWYHGCHVMDRETCANNGGLDVLTKNYVVLKLDQNAHPDLPARNGDWGWPATIVFAPDSRELHKHRGCIGAPAMVDMLNAGVGHPTPRTSAIVVPAFARQSSRSRLVWPWIACTRAPCTPAIDAACKLNGQHAFGSQSTRALLRCTNDQRRDC